MIPLMQLQCIFTAMQAIAAGADLAIATGLVVVLFRRRKHALRGLVPSTVFQYDGRRLLMGTYVCRTRSTLQKLLVLTINTGIWTGLFAMFTFITVSFFFASLSHLTERRRRDTNASFPPFRCWHSKTR